MANQSENDLHGRLFKFLIEEMERDEHHQCVKLELFYQPAGEARRDSLKSWHRQNEADQPYFLPRGDKGAQIYIDRLAQEMIELAEYHADSYGMGRQRFKVVSHHAMGGGRHTHGFVILPTSDGSSAELDASELAPTTGGLQLQLMRHLENQQKLNKDMMTSFAGAMREAMTQLRTDNERLHTLIRERDAARLSELKEIEEARSKQHEQEIEAAIVTSEAERKAFANKKIFGLLPVAISRFIEGRDEDKADSKDGKKAKKWKPSPLSIALGELAESLSEDQEEAIGAVLSIEQKIMLGEAIRVAKKGGSVILPQIVHDLFATLEREQLTKILAKLDGSQQQMIMRAVSLAKAEAEPDVSSKKASPSAGDGDTKASAPPNGAAQ